MLKKRTSVPYWSEFQNYQTFTSVEDMKNRFKSFEKEFDLPESYKAVLNTIKLHAKNYIGVCWLFREEIAKKCGYSTSTVDRAITAFKKAGLLITKQFNHTKFGRRTHNLYIVTNPSSLTLVEPITEDSEEVVDETVDETIDEVCDEASTPTGQPSNPCGSKAEAVSEIPYKNLNSDSNSDPNKNLNTLNLKLNDNIDKGFTPLDQCEKETTLKHVPQEFLEIVNPFYGHQPETIVSLWKTTCVAIKKGCSNFSHTSWDSIRSVWKTVNNRFKRKLINGVKNAVSVDESDDALGGYYYGVLSRRMQEDYMESMRKYWSSADCAENVALLAAKY